MGEDGPLRAGDEGEDPRVAEALRGGDREGGEDVHGRGGQAPEGVPEAPGGQGSDGYGGEGVWPRAHEVREGGGRQGGALSVKTVRASEVVDQSASRRRCCFNDGGMSLSEIQRGGYSNTKS